MSMGAVLLPVLLTLHWALAPVVADDGCRGFRHLENGRTFFRYGGLYVTFSCNPGFRIHGYRTSSCVSGQWAREPPLCVAPGCPIPGEILHGSRVVSQDVSLVRFTCDVGFRLFGSPLLYCKGERWNGTMPVCKESDIMSLFQLKQTLYKPDLKESILPSLKNHFNTIANTAGRETFLKTSFPGVPKPKSSLTGDVSKVSQKPPEKKPAKKHWSDKVTTQAKGGTVSLKETVTRLDVMREPIQMADSLAQPLAVAKLVDTTTISAYSHTTYAPLSRPAELSVLTTPAMNDHNAEVSSRLMHQIVSASLNKGNEHKNHFTSATHRSQVTPSPVLSVSGRKDLSMLLTTTGLHSEKVNTNIPQKSTTKDTSTLAAKGDSVFSPVAVVGSGVLFPSNSDDLTTLSSPNPYVVSSSMFIPAQIRNKASSFQGTLTADTDEGLLPKMKALTVTTQIASAMPLTVSPDVTVKVSYLQHFLAYREQSNTENSVAKSIDGHSLMDSLINEELRNVSRMGRIRPAGSSLLTPNLKKRTSLNGSHGSENPASNQTIVKQIVNFTRTTSEEIPEYLIRKRRPVCPYPPLPAHGTFYFRTILNPAPFQYKHYIQYACYPGYTLANGDVYSYCLQDGQWSGVTPMCIEETPCSLNNGGCSQVCHVNEQNHAGCNCRPGFQLLEDQRTCRDLDECVEGLHRCQQVCENTFGSYKCSCNSGFQLTADRTSCTDINECTVKNGGCSHICINQQGGYKCACPENDHISSHNRRQCHPVYSSQRTVT